MTAKGAVPNLRSTPASRSDEYFTPIDVLRPVRALFEGGIDLDPASCAQANQVVQAARYYTRTENGLQQSWKARTLWINPPFSLKTAFLARLNQAYERGETREAVCLLPITLGTIAWRRYCASYPFVAWHRRMRFAGASESANFDAALLYLGPRVDRFIELMAPHGLIYGPARNALLPRTQWALVPEEEAS